LLAAAAKAAALEQLTSAAAEAKLGTGDISDAADDVARAFQGS
jgi:hypothetical protein